ncbi:MAG TPA: hypothetical protein DCO65_10135 [Spartobacteria bacterium]|jgi:hypothetical protein|nr:hypothetical protein [Spartobacteria bacterium]
MNKKEEKKLIRLISAISDIDESLNAADAIIAGAPSPLYGHLFLSMAVSYCRPFTQSDGIGSILVEYPNFPDFGGDDMRARHQRMLDLRNKFLAHSSAEGTRVQIIPPGIPNPLGNPPKATFDFNIGKRRFPKVEFIEWLRVLPPCFRESAA